MYFKNRRQTVLKLAMTAHKNTFARVSALFSHTLTRLESRLCLKSFGQNSHKAKIRTRTHAQHFYL